MRHLAALLFLLTCSLPVLAGEILIPAVFRGNGANGTVWRTELVITNISTEHPEPATGTIAFDSNVFQPGSVFFFTLAPRETLSIPDFLGDWLHMEQGAGILRVAWNDSDAKITARARIYNVGSSAGEFGQSVPGMATDALLLDNYLPGISGVNGNRTNVGVSNPHGSDVQYWIELFESSGNSRGSFSSVVPADSYVQLNDIFSRFQAGPLDGATIRVTAIAKPLYPWASVVRNDSDATFIAPAK